MLLVPLYLSTAIFGRDANVDAEAAALQAWRVADAGTLDLTGVDTANPWIVDGDGRTVSNRAPGLWAIAIPAYLLDPHDGFRIGPSTIVALLATVAAIVLLHLLLRRHVPPWWAMGGAAAVALGTATWPVSSAQLWPHGPGQLVAVLGLWAAARERRVQEALVWAFGILVRLPVAVVPVTLAVVRMLGRRLHAAIAPAAAVALGVGATVAYNAWVFGEPSLSGGYQSLFRENLTDQSPADYVTNLFRMVVGPDNGMLVWSPVLVVACVAAVTGWRAAPRWSRDAAIAGVAYILVHARLNRASGGLAFDYRYQLEAIVLATPLLVIATHAWLTTERRRMALVLTLALSIGLQGMVAYTLECESGPGTAASCTLL